MRSITGNTADKQISAGSLCTGLAFELHDHHLQKCNRMQLLLKTLQTVVHQAIGEPKRVSFQIMLQMSGHSSHFPFGSYLLICLLAFTFVWS